MSSLTTIRSTSLTTSLFKELDSIRAWIIFTGLIFAKSSSSDLNLNSPVSGLLSLGRMSNLGSPIAASRTASDSLQAFRVLSGRGSFSFSIALPPKQSSWKLKLSRCFSSIFSNTFKVTFVISGPIPSPESRTILCEMTIYQLLYHDCILGLEY